MKRTIALFVLILLTTGIGFSQPGGGNGNGPPCDRPNPPPSCACEQPNPPPYCDNNNPVPLSGIEWLILGGLLIGGVGIGRRRS